LDLLTTQEYNTDMSMTYQRCIYPFNLVNIGHTSKKNYVM